MNYPLISEYVETIRSAEDNLAELNYLHPVLNANGDPVMTGGNFAVVFKMQDKNTGKYYALKCFTKEQEGRAESYKMIAEELEFVNTTYFTHFKYYDKELFVDCANSDETEFPVVLMDWVEGTTLDKYIRKHLDDQYDLSLLAYQFSRLAMWLMPQPFAHGDLKPENILVQDDGTLVLVDYDGMYVPVMKGQKARELGSPDFRHPSRTEDDFDEHIDDFALASILLSLKAVSLKPDLLEQYGASDRLLFSEKDYRNLSESEVMDALKPLVQVSELASLYSLFILAITQNNLSQVSFRLLSLGRPKTPVLPDVNKYCSIKIEDSDGYEVDKYGAIYSHGRKILLKLPCDVIQYNVEEGTEIIATGAFDHFDVVAGGGAVDIFESDLEYLYLPTSVKYITESAFLEDGRRIKEIRVANNPNYYKHYLSAWANKIVKAKPFDNIITRSKSVYDIAGAEYSQDGKTLISLYWLSPDILSYQIKEGVKTIKFGAAQLAKTIHEIVVPSGVEYIEGAAFVNSSLSNIKLPLTLRPLDSDIFSGCNNLRSIVIPEGTKALYEGMMPKYKDKLVEEEDTNNYSTKINEEDFETAWVDESGVMYSADRKRLLKAPKDIEEYSIKEGTKVICNGFSSKYEWGRNITGAFKGCTLLRSIIIPDSITKIGNVAFEGCNSLTKLSITNSVKQIGAGAFCNCRNLKVINLPYDLEVIAGNTFEGCVSLKTILIPYNVNKIGRCAFYCCEQLSSIIIPNEVVEIEDEAFAGCTNLSSVTLSFKTKTMGYGIFNSCDSLETIYLTSTHNMFGVYVREEFGKMIPDHADKIWEIQDTEIYATSISDFDKRNNVKDEFDVVYSIDGKRLLYAPDNLIDYTIKDGTKFICKYAFSKCENLTSLIIPESVAEIGENAFEDCTALQKIDLPNSIIKVGESAFSGCRQLFSIKLSNRLVEIEGHVFQYCSSLKTIIFPDSLKKINSMAFEWCKGLISIFIPAGVIYVDNNAFAGCSNLKSIVVDKSNGKYNSRNDCNAIILGDTLIVGCLNTIIPEGIKVIGDSAFAGCLNLKNLIIPMGVKEIESFAFNACVGLKTINIPEGVTAIGTSAFNGCHDLESITIPQSVDKIGWHAFWDCGSLQSIYVPKGTKKKYEILVPDRERNGKLIEQ